jgi:hypothetical protein
MGKEGRVRHPCVTLEGLTTNTLGQVVATTASLPPHEYPIQT